MGAWQHEEGGVRGGRVGEGTAVAREYKCCMTCWRSGKCNMPLLRGNLDLQFATSHSATSLSL